MLQDCGHYPHKDAQLIDGTFGGLHGSAAQTSSSVSPAIRPQSSAKTVLVYDERMEQHVEGRHQPHPERPDRIRAVMARLLASGLAGEHSVCRTRPFHSSAGTSAA